MGNCAKCGKGLNWGERNTFFFNNQLKDGYIKAPITHPCYKYGRRELPAYKGKKICTSCLETVMLFGGAKGKNCINCGYCDEQQIAKGFAPALVGTAVIFDKSYKCRKFSLNINGNNCSSAESCSSYLTKEEYTKKCLSGEMNKDKVNVQIIIDFSSLKDVMSKGGVVMSAYNCPNCNAMVDIPEAGKILICKHCGTPIKPVDIFEKIKSLMQ
jgi:hypothetical protein